MTSTLQSFRLGKLELELQGYLAGHVSTHSVIDAPARINDLGMVTEFGRFKSKIVRVDSNAMSSHQSGKEFQKIPFGSGSLQHLVGIDVHFVEDHGQLIHEGNVDVALCVFNDLGGFGHFDGARPCAPRPR